MWKDGLPPTYHNIYIIPIHSPENVYIIILNLLIMPEPISKISGKIFNTLNPKRFSVSTEKAQKIAKLKKIQVAHVGTNANYFTFTEEELMQAASSLKDKPIYINYLGVAPDDHADNSSMNTIGWSTDAWYDPEDQTLYANGDVTTPDVVEKLERMDSKGRRELNFVSMSCDAVPICSICGNVFTDCEHERGEKYEGKECSVIGKEVAFRNFVLTNEPADPNAVIGEVAIENASLQKKGVHMKKTNEKAQEVELKPPEIEEKKTASVEDMVAGLQKQLMEMEARIAAIEGAKTEETSAKDETKKEEEKKKEEKPDTEEKKEETSAAGNAPLPNPPADASPPAMSTTEAKPTDVTPPTPPEGKKPATVDVNKPVDKLPDGSTVDNKPATTESVPEVDKLKNEVSTLKTENAKFRASQVRESMKEFASKKKELISLGFAEAAEKANTAKELDCALEVARKSNVSTRRERYAGSDLPKYTDSRGTMIEDAGKVKIDLSKRGGAIAALREAATKGKK